MGRTEIPDDGGMIFVYPDSQLRSMWMANCVIDMDVIFLDRSGRILTGYAMKAEAGEARRRNAVAVRSPPPPLPHPSARRSSRSNSKQAR